MKLLAVATVAFAAYAAGNVIDTTSKLSSVSRFSIADLQPVNLTNSPGFINENPATGFDHDPADPATRARYIQKGSQFICLLRKSDQQAGTELQDTRSPPSAASPWQGNLQQELATWNWFSFDAKQHYHADFDGYWYLSRALAALGLNTRPAQDGGQNTAYRIEHWDPNQKDSSGIGVPGGEQRYTVEGKEYRCTKASFELTINTSGGAIFAQYLTGPSSSVWEYWHRAALPSELPAIRHLSDVLWGFWVRENNNVRNIRYYIVQGIVNEVTRELLAWIMLNKGEFATWPGHTFSMGSEEGRALLGSPIGATFAHFLIQHKAQLGLKTVSKVTVIIPENDLEDELDPEHDPTLIFHVEDAEVGTLEQGEMVESVERRAEDVKHVMRVHRMSFL